MKIMLFIACSVSLFLSNLSAAEFSDFLKSKTFVEGHKSFEKNIKQRQFKGLLDQEDVEKLANLALQLNRNKMTEFVVKDPKRIDQMENSINLFEKYPYSLSTALKFYSVVDTLRESYAVLVRAIKSRSTDGSMTKESSDDLDSMLREINDLSMRSRTHLSVLVVVTDLQLSQLYHPLGPIKSKKKMQNEIK